MTGVQTCALPIYTSTPIMDQLNDSTLGQTSFYVQSMAGVKTKINFPYLNSFADSDYNAINMALLTVTAEESSTDVYTTPSQLYVIGIDKDGKGVFIQDQFEDGTHYGGSYDSSNHEIGRAHV